MLVDAIAMGLTPEILRYAQDDGALVRAEYLLRE
jgi:hypothetical protein